MNSLELVLTLILSALQISDGHVMDNFSRKLKQADNNTPIEECFKGSKKVLTQYPYEVALRNPIDKNPNEYVLCSGSLIDPFTILTSAGCIWQNVVNGIPFDLNGLNPVNNTFDLEFKAAVAPYCAQGDGAQLVDLYGYQLMEYYDGWPVHGNAAALIKMTEPVSSIAAKDIPELRRSELPVGSVLTMVAFGAQTNAQASLQDQQSSYPHKKIEFVTISDSECRRLITQQFENKELDTATETCAVVNGDFDIGVCNGDDGSTLLDQDGKIVGTLTWWTVNRCEVTKDSTMPIVFADVTKTKVADFIRDAKDKPLTKPPNVTDGCANGQLFDEAPFTVSVQIPQYTNPDNFHHVCNAILIDDGKRIMTSASCVWNDYFPAPTGQSVAYDLRDYTAPYSGSFIPQFIFATLAPRCRNLNSQFERSSIVSYHIHPQYNGNPNDGYDIAILDLEVPFPAENAFNSLPLQERLDIRDFSEATFYGWGASFQQEARQDEKGVFNNYTPGKAVPMKLIPDNDCARTLLLENTKNNFDRLTEFCALIDSNTANFQDLCMYDVGGPLISQTNGQLQLLGLMTKQQDRRCLGGRDFPKVFTEVGALAEFILEVVGDFQLEAVARSSMILG
eukprot:TRINITY_DN5052_c0_g1_i9.p1 TRINITY_DN5052_c0_g1~~TRINITY_DN5052_c0_g1_i9.p1  ORF type:complete len:620 (-),score=90.87 TRINITY_DN5052_c0_g1_i9:671-2530(-)